MTGFRAPRTTFLLQFTDPTFEGLEVRVRSLSVDGFSGLGDIARFSQITAATFTAQDMAMVDRLFDRFAAALVSWNVEDEDGPVPATREAIGGQDVMFMLNIAIEWINAIIGVPAPLEPSSNGGGPSAPPVPIPMEPLSGSPTSSPTPS